MSIIASADLHLTDKPSDEYRWGLFPFLIKQVRKTGAKFVVLAGDITDAKDKHSAILTNRMVDNLAMLGKEAMVIILRGNHDYIDEGNPFFGFARHLKNVSFIVKPTLMILTGYEVLLLPNTRDYEKDWKGLDFAAPKFIFAHQTFDGCLTENGTRLPGIPPSVFAGTKAKVFSGDIHVPQKIGKNIEYIGAPYRIRFGDSFEPRVLFIGDDGKTEDLKLSVQSKVLVDLSSPSSAKEVVKLLNRALDKAEVFNGDQVKVRVSMKRSAFADWPAIRAAIVVAAVDNGIELVGPELVAELTKSEKPKDGQKLLVEAVSPLGMLQAYAKKKALPNELKIAGEAILKSAVGCVE